MKKVLIIGAGEGGKRLLGEIERAHSNLKVLGFLDDNQNLQKSKIHNLPILGTTGKLTVFKGKVDEIIIAIPSLRGSKLSKIVNKIQGMEIPFKIMPGIFESIEYYSRKQVEAGKIREIELADLLNRESIEINLDQVSSYLKNKRVLITGAGGSIGSEIARQVSQFQPEKLIILDIYENNLYELQDELNCPFEPVVADIKDVKHLKYIFEKTQPQIIFHAAAHKHVPLMEGEPREAVKNNILGSANLLELAKEFSVEKFIFISSDKAINPSSIMGATKRFTEQQINSIEYSKTIFSIVRFGNVLGSSGSVIPLWKKQLKMGKPLTVTDPRMRRFFMTIPEAVSLVIQAGALANHSEVYALKMGKQYKILDLASDFLKLSGFVPDKSGKIKITQKRPGEKLSETLYENGEKISPSTHDKILIVHPKKVHNFQVSKILNSFKNSIDNLSYNDIVKLLKTTIPTFITDRELIKKPPKTPRKIQFAPPAVGNDEISAVGLVLKSGWLTMGEKVIEFENKFAQFHQIKNALAVSSATAGLHLALLGLGVGPGDEIILPAYTFASCANTIVWTGAKPIFADISQNGFLIDPLDAERKITPKTKAIMVVHFGGQMVEMDEILQIARTRHLKIIEDCAHSPGASYHGQFAGTIGDVGVFSFYATKNITTGEGGMVITNNDGLAAKMRILRLHGLSADAFNRYSAKGHWFYEIIEAGFKYNLTDIAAAIGLEQLKKLTKFNHQREQIAKQYSDLLSGRNDLVLPAVLPGRKNVWQLFPILVEASKRNQLIEKMADFNIATSVHFIPLHLQPFYREKFHFKKGDLPVTEEVFSKEISLPIYPGLQGKDVKYITEVLKYLIAR